MAVELTSEAAQRAAIVAEARTWLGTPFAMGQCSKGYGVDCGMLLAACYRAAGIELPTGFGIFRHDWHLHTREELYLGIVEAHTTRVEVPAPGDIVLIRAKASQPFSHAALVIDWPRLIHAAWFRAGGYVCELDAVRGLAPFAETRFYSHWGTALQ